MSEVLDKPEIITISRFLDPTNDVAFKRIFENTARLIDFLNSLLERRIGSRIVSVMPISIEELPNIGDGKRSLFDIKVKDDEGKTYVIEMQRGHDSYFKSRIQCYGAHTLVSMLRKGEEKPYVNATPVIVVSISKHNLFDETVPCISFHKSVEDTTGTCHLQLLRYLFIELGKFTKTEDELQTIEDEWVFFFKSWEYLKEPPSHVKDQFVKEAYKEIERFNWSVEQYDAYFRADMTFWQEVENLDERYERGKKEGKDEGKAEGKAEGMAYVAKKLFAQGKDAKYISDLTGLTEDEIKRL